MKETTLPLPQLGLIAATRGMLGAGIGLLLADKLAPEARKAAGVTLLAVGILTTIPLAMQVFGGANANAVGTTTGAPSVPGTWEQREAVRNAVEA